MILDYIIQGIQFVLSFPFKPFKWIWGKIINSISAQVAQHSPKFPRDVAAKQIPRPISSDFILHGQNLLEHKNGILFCYNCYQDNKSEILQREVTPGLAVVQYRCLECDYVQTAPKNTS